MHFLSLIRTFAGRKTRIMEKDRRKHRFLEAFGVVVIILALVRCGLDMCLTNDQVPAVMSEAVSADTIASDPLPEPEPMPMKHVSTRYLADGQRPHKIFSVSSYHTAFPDINDVQMVAARRWGVKPVKNREDAEARKDELVYVDCSPYYYIDPLYSSVPYLVPRAAILLQDIGRAFFDSLQVKGVPLHRFIVTSVLRTQEDVAKLRRHNGNATENSCHLFGTTFDISYTRYGALRVPGERQRRAVRDDTLKFILSEVLNDARQQGKCYVKYEKKQKCFHITVR